MGLSTETHVPVGQRNFGILSAKMSEILENSRAASARKTPDPTQIQDSALDNAKSEDRAKMTHSIPDIMSRHGLNPPIYCQYLPLERGNTPIQYLESLETILRTFLNSVSDIRAHRAEIKVRFPL